MLNRNSRQFLLSAATLLPRANKHRRITSFADPHPLTPLESYRFKKRTGPGVRLPSDCRESRDLSPQLNPSAATLMNLLATLPNKRLNGLPKPFTSNTHKKPPRTASPN